MLIIVTYDIPDDRRRLRVAQALEDFGFRVQYSVFEAVLDDGERQRLLARLEKLVDTGDDKLRVYGLCGTCETNVIVMGAGARTTEPEVFVL